MNISNIHVSNYDPHCSKAAAGWTDASGLLYHFWFNTETKEIHVSYGVKFRKAATIYKNPPKGTERHTTGYFDTRRLDAETKGNAAIVAHVFAEIEKRGLMAQAVAEYEEEQRTRNEAARVGRLNARIQENGPLLLAALKRLTDRDALYDGGKVVLEFATHGEALAAFNDARYVLSVIETDTVKPQ